MLAEDEDALVCDFAETYHVLDLYALPVEKAATLAAGLRSNSRIRTKMSGIEEPLDTFLLASAVDAMRLSVWAQTKDASKGRNRPKSLAEEMIHRDKKVVGYKSASEFDKMRERILRSKHGC